MTYEEWIEHDKKHSSRFPELDLNVDGTDLEVNFVENPYYIPTETTSIKHNGIKVDQGWQLCKKKGVWVLSWGSTSKIVKHQAGLWFCINGNTFEAYKWEG